MSTTNSDTLPETEVWVEKYRPEAIDDIVGQDDITSSLSGYIDQGHLPNLLFAGSAGLGKTTAAIALAKELYGDDWSNNFIELNASDQRGIDVVRDRVKEFSRSALGGYDYRLIFLDEADSLTDDAQAALRRTMEQFSDNVRFILSCNYSSQIIDPIQSRCKVYRFTGIPESAMKSHIQWIAEQEDITVTDNGLDALIYVSNGDMRTAINALQGTAIMEGTVTEDRVHNVTSTPRPEEIEHMVTEALNGNYKKSQQILTELLTEHGLAGGDVLDQLHRLIWNFDLTEHEAVAIIDEIGECDYRLSEGGHDKIQLESLLATITKLNDS